MYTLLVTLSSGIRLSEVCKNRRTMKSNEK
jgi:hypothetical protein